MPGCFEQGVGVGSVVAVAGGMLGSLKVPTVAFGNSVWNQSKVSVRLSKFGISKAPPSPTQVSPLGQQPYSPLLPSWQLVVDGQPTPSGQHMSFR